MELGGEHDNDFVRILHTQLDIEVLAVGNNYSVTDLGK
jgi:hypothetical protein